MDTRRQSQASQSDLSISPTYSLISVPRYQTSETEEQDKMSPTIGSGYSLPLIVSSINSSLQTSPAQAFLKYSDASPTPFHATAVSAALLEKDGFVRLKEQDAWDGKIEAGGKYFFTRNQSAIVAFGVGKQFQPGVSGVHLVGAHTDSPNFHIKPVSKRTKEGYLQCGVETYGGGLWSTWFDRDLSLAGRVIVATTASQNAFESRLVKVDRTLLRIPTLAIHLNRSANDAFKFNQETEMVPILGLADKAKEALNAPAKTDEDAITGEPRMQEKHHSMLLELLAGELGVQVEQIQDFELSLYDTQKATIGGLNDEFIHAARLDNQMSCFCATTALIEATRGGSLSNSSSIQAIALFDNEEVGSVSTHGAESNMLSSTVRRLGSMSILGLESIKNEDHLHPTNYERSISKSFLISSDMAHGFHPNYSSFYEDNHRPKINGGVVIKTNAKQRYASTAPTTFLIRRIAKLASVPLQEFEVRNDMPCGSTIGPMMSKTGIRTVDLGSPQLSMHSIRETSGTKDVKYKIDLFAGFFRDFDKVDSELVVD